MGSNQNFVFDASAQRLYLKNSKKCIDLKGGISDNGNAVVLWDCTSGWNQWWQVLDPLQIVELPNKKCMDVSMNKAYAGAKIQIWDCNYYDQQLWTFDPGSWRIQYAPNPQYCMDVPGNKVSTGVYLQLWPCNGMNSQKWGWDSNAKRIFLAQDSRKCLDLPGSSTKNGDLVWLWDCDKAVSWGMFRASWGHKTTLGEMPAHFANSSVFV